MRIYQSAFLALHPARPCPTLTSSPLQIFDLGSSNFVIPTRKHRGRERVRGSGKCLFPLEAPSADTTPPRTVCAALLGRVRGACFSDGRSTAAGRALAEVHAPLGGPQWLLCALVAEGFFLGHSWSKGRTGADTRAAAWPCRRLCDFLAGGMWRLRRAAVAW